MRQREWRGGSGGCNVYDIDKRQLIRNSHIALNERFGQGKTHYYVSLKTSRAKVEALSKTLGVDVEKLMKGEVEHTEASDMKLIELEGEVELLKHLEAELKELESLEICK